MGDTPEHLKSTRFQPGHAPTPGAGRKRSKPISDAYLRMLSMPLPAKICKALDVRLGSTYLEGMTEVHFRTCLRSNEVGVHARRELADRVQGKSAVSFELHHEEQYEICVVFEQPVRRCVEGTKAIVRQLPASEDEASSEPSES